MIPALSPTEAAARHDLRILDVREPEEWALVHLPESRLIPLGDLPDRVEEVPRDRPVACLCHHGIRSHRAAALLAAAGFPEVYNITGGIDRWAREVDPSLRRY